MATSLVIEEERGTYSRSPHPHNGYYAGDFSSSSRDASYRAFPHRSTTTPCIR